MKRRSLTFITLFFLILLSGCRAPSFDPETPGAAAEKNLLILDLAHAGNRLLAAGEAGSILYSDDQGAHWAIARTPASTLLTALFFVDDRHGWAVGHDLLILATSDGGLNWTRQFSAPQESRPLLDVWFRNPREGYAVGAYGALLSTMDGGATWQSRQQPEDDRHLYSILGTPDGVMLIAGETGTLRRSSDQGVTWQPVTTPYAGSFFGMLQPRDGSVLLFGMRGHILRSTDQGLHWEEIPNPGNASLLGGTVLDDGKLILVGAAGVILESADAGKTFALHRSPGRTAWASAAGTAQGLLLAGEAGIHQFRN